MNNMKQFSLEEYLEHPDRKVVTRDGRSVRIICTDADTARCVVGLIRLKKEESLTNYYYNGTRWANSISNDDLFFVPEKYEGWLNIYKSPTLGYNPGCIFNSKDEAINSKSKEQEYIGTCKIEWEE